ncbi:MAG: type II toxin-antitoxin system YafQ family toxin [Candidatus Hydrogenedentes bacterium]|nr:type II toxin-antitoxin system YafQ family toxin [Candidatus Hydrogenedentota bacterium]
MKRLVWGSTFKRAFRKRVQGGSDEAPFRRQLALFVTNPLDPRLQTHKLTGKLQHLWAFTVSYDCRVVFKFTSDEEVVLIDIGSHDEVY